MTLDDKKRKILIGVGIAAVILALFLGVQIIMQQVSVIRGVDYLEEGEYQKAYESFLDAENKYTLFTSKNNIRYYEGESLIYLGRYEDAADVYGEILDRHKEARAYALQGFALQQSGNGEEALQAYEAAIDTDSKNGTGYYYLYGYYVEQEQYEEALAVLEEAQAVPVTSMEQEIAYAKIVVYEKLLQYDKALEEANSYCEAYPDDEKGLNEKTFLESR